MNVCLILLLVSTSLCQVYTAEVGPAPVTCPCGTEISGVRSFIERHHVEQWKTIKDKSSETNQLITAEVNDLKAKLSHEMADMQKSIQAEMVVMIRKLELTFTKAITDLTQKVTTASTTMAPTTEAPTTMAPTTTAPTTTAPSTAAPTTMAPTTEAATTTAPTTEAPTTEAATTEAPTTEAPTTEAATTEAPTTEAPTTEAPTTEAPTTEAPTTKAPTTEAPTTEAPTTEAPSTEAPTTEAPTTEAPTTKAPTTTKKPEISCSKGWTKVGDGCYKAFERRLSWTSAEANCVRNGAHLITASSKQKMKAIERALPAGFRGNWYTWVGGRFDDATQQWLWVADKQPVTNLRGLRYNGSGGQCLAYVWGPGVLMVNHCHDNSDMHICEIK